MEWFGGLRQNECEKCASKLLFFERAVTKPRKAVDELAGIQSRHLQNMSYTLYCLIQLNF
jgi:hypothetical protein